MSLPSLGTELPTVDKGIAVPVGAGVNVSSGVEVSIALAVGFAVEDEIKTESVPG